MGASRNGRARTRQEPKLREQDFRHSRHRDFDADTYHPQPRTFGTRPRFSQSFEAPSGPPVRGLVSSIPKRGLDLSNSRMGLATPSSTGACWLSAASTPCNRVKPSKSASVRDTRDHTSPRSSASIAAPLSRRRHGERISGRRYRTGHLRASLSRRPAQ